MVLYLFFSLITNIYTSQIHPSVDPNYILQTNSSDDFNGLDIDTSVWDKMNWAENPHEHISWGGNSNWKPSNVSVDTDYLALRVDAPVENGFDTTSLGLNECCHTGGLISIDTNYKYGYYESRIKLPGHFKSDGTPTHHKFHPAWWMFNSEQLNGCKLTHFEIDIVEPDPFEFRGYPSGRSNNYGLWAKDPTQYCTDSTSGVLKYIQDANVSETPLFEDFHTYALEWDADKFIYYFDNVALAEFHHPILATMDSMKMVLGLQIKDKGFGGQGLLFDSNAVFPHYMMVDYMNYYKLNYNCNEVSNIITNIALDNFVYGVKKKINISYSAGNVTLNPTKMIFGAKPPEEVLLGL